MSNEQFQQLEVDQIIPAFSLPGTDGMIYSPWAYKQKENLIVLLLQSTQRESAQHVLRIFAQHYAEIREELCTILAITPDPVLLNLEAQERLHLPYPLLADPQGKVIARYTIWQSHDRTLRPALVLTNRYGALYQQWIVENEDGLPSLQTLKESLVYLNSICTP